MFAQWGSFSAQTSKRRKPKRRLGAELLEDRGLLSAVPTPAAVDAQSLAMAEQATSPSPSPVNQAFVNNVYRDLLGRNPSNSELQYWEGFLYANNAPLQSTGSGGVGTALTGAPVGGYALSEFPGSTGANNPVPVGPTSGPGVSTSELDYGTAMGASESAFPNGAGPLTTGTNAGVLGGSPGSTFPTAQVSSQAAAESVNLATAPSPDQSNQFVQAVLASPEYQQRVVTQVFEDFLHRAPTSNDLAYFGNQISAAGERSVLVDVLASPEYFGRAGATDAGYVDALYRDVLGRTPSAQDSQAWVSQLAAGGGGASARAMVASDILNSPEASGLVINNPTANALASLTGGGFNQLLFQGGLAAAAQESYAAALGDNRAFESVLESMVASNQFYAYPTGPGPVDNPGFPSTEPGSTSS